MSNRIAFGILALVVALTAAADTAVPPLVNYQGVLTDENGQTIQDGVRKLEFNLYDAPIAGNKVWGPQVFDNVPIIGGRFNVILGTTDTGGRSLVGAFSASQRYLGVKVGAVGQDLANVVEMAPRQQILSAPYALVAEKVKQLDEVLFPEKNTDRARIVFESQGDGARQSNMVFETFDNNDEGFVFRTNGFERRGN